MNTEPNPLFENFQPGQTPAPSPAMGAAIAAGMEQAATGKKKPRKAKPASPKKAAAKKAPRKQAVGKAAKAKLPKFSLAQVMGATAGLKEGDRAVFESLLVSFHVLGKPARERILVALGKIFA